MLIEVTVHRSITSSSSAAVTPIIHVYKVIEHGRRFYRKIVFSSDSDLCLHDMEPSLFVYGDTTYMMSLDQEAMAEAALPSDSLVITRNVDEARGEQMLLPKRLLLGLLPSS